MTDLPVSRRLAAILAADVVGYAGLMERDEVATLGRLKARRSAVLSPLVGRYAGRIVKLMGDGVLVEFASAVNAVQCALELQQEMTRANAAEPELAPILLRIGINVGDVVVDGTDLYGDGVNIAARLESISEPGVVYISRKVQEELRGKLNLDYVDLGEVALKNIAMPVRVYRLGRTEIQRPVDVSIALKPSGTPSLAVLPFKNLSSDPSDQHLAQGLTEDVLTDLSRFRNLRVIARHAPVESGGAGLQRIAAETGADYIAEGSVRRTEASVRITIQLVEAVSSNRIWSEKYDVVSSEIDKVVGAIVASLEQRMVGVAAALARMKPSASWTAYDYLLQGRDLCNAYREPEAVPFFLKAIEIDRNFAHAHAWLALALTVRFSESSNPEDLAQAAVHAKAALSLDSNDPTVHHANAMALTWLRDHDRAGNHYDRAVALNPADIQVRADRSNWLRFCGRLNEALAEIDRVIGQSVACPPWFWAVRGEILFDTKLYADALASFSNVPGKTHRDIYIAAAHAYLGDQHRAAATAQEVLTNRPDLTEADIRRVKPHAVEQTLTHLIDGLRMAGVLK
ncbi:MAG TPA: adenylate/guanylate cyclase domain-containing protein [Dongiaceae bacterium]